MKANSWEDYYIESASMASATMLTEEITIPVSVHRVSTSGNVSDLSEGEWDGVLGKVNTALGGQSPCPGWEGDGPDSGIRLCRALRSIDGQPSTGLSYTQDPLGVFDACRDEDQLKRLGQAGTRYPSTGYLNIWVVDTLCGSCFPSGCMVSGLATMSPAHGSDADGIIIERDVLATCEGLKLLIHELGHYLNLYHTFEGGCRNDDCLRDGDRVCDTPPDAGSNLLPDHPCLAGQQENTCDTDVNPGDPNSPWSSDQADSTDNYMDYAPSPCIHRFTEGQIQRMRQCLTGPRRSLLDSEGCSAPCDTLITASYRVVPDTPGVGQSFRIEIFATGATGHSATYSGQTLQGTRPEWTASSEGEQYAVVRSFNGDTDCTREDTVRFYIACMATPVISAEKTQLSFGEDARVTLDVIPTEGSWNWYVNGQEYQQGGQSIELSELEEGSYLVQLKHCYDGCCRWSQGLWLRSGACQSEAMGYEWYFGSGGIGFNPDGSVYELPDRSVGANGRLVLGEGLANCYDEHDGSILFYTGGGRIGNKFHTFVRKNFFIEGSVASARGSSSSTQKIILRKPGQDSLYFVFCPDTHDNDPAKDSVSPLYYGVIDRHLFGDQGGLLFEPVPLYFPASEKIMAAKHCNGRDWWVVSKERGSNAFYTYLLDADSLHTNPVISYTGRFLENSGGAKVGNLKISNDQKYLIHTASSANDAFGEMVGFAELLQFDNSTGQVSGGIIVADSLFNCYAAEFSPDGSKLYVLTEEITQYNLEVMNPDSIRNSAYVVDYYEFPVTGAMRGIQQDPFGRVMILQQGRDEILALIEKPNEYGPDIRYIKPFFKMSYRTNLGLPTLPTSLYYPEKRFIRGPKRVCASDTTLRYYFHNSCSFALTRWEHRGPNAWTALSNDTVLLNPIHPGADTLLLFTETACRRWTDTLILEVRDCRTPPDPPCTLAFDAYLSQPTACPEYPPYVRYQASGDLLILVREDGSIADTLALNGTRTFPGLKRDTCVRFTLMDTTARCDTTITYCFTAPEPPPQVQWRASPRIVCPEAYTQLLIDRPPGQIVRLVDQNMGRMRTIQTDTTALGPFLADSCYWLMITDTLSGCQQVRSLCFYLDTDQRSGRDTVFTCPGQPAQYRGQDYNAGAHEIDLLTESGCDSTVSLIVIEVDVPQPTVNINPACPNQRTGSISIANHPEAARYDWSDGAQGPSRTALDSGQYTLTIIWSIPAAHNDTVECTEEYTFRVPTAPPVVPAWRVDSETCLGSDNGSVRLESVNGESPSRVELSFDGGAFTKKYDYAGLSPGAYPVAWRDTLGCTYIDTLIVGAGAERLETVDSVRLCPGDSLWYDNGWITQAGEYQTDTLSSFGCDSTHKLSVAIFPTTRIDINTTDACPDGANGSARLDTSEGALSDITWSDGVTAAVYRTDLGAGTYTVEWRDENGCRGQQTFSIGQHIATTPTIELEDVVCAGDSTGVLYWSNEDVDSVMLIGSDGRRLIDAGGEVGGLPEGSYQIVWYDRWGCTGEDSLKIEAYPETELQLPDTLRVVRGQRIVLELEVISSWAYRVSWSPGVNLSCTDCQRPELEVTGDGIYTATVEDAEGCITDRTVVVLMLEPSGKFFVPNAFTPNEDGHNDLLEVHGAYGLNLEMIIYDRWGNAVFDCRGDATICRWDGRAGGGRYVPPGVYVYRLVVQTPKGPEVMVGDVTVLR